MTISRRELRRMAYRAGRVPGMRAVLHDALLETFPREYQHKIDAVDQWDKEHGYRHTVFFDPLALISKRVHRSLFYMFGDVAATELRRHDPYRRVVLVYESRPKRRS